MTEEELLRRWASERAMYEAWGQHVVTRIVDAVGSGIAPLATDIFIRIPPKPRLKTDASFLEKAFYRKKPYANPYDDITDKVGVRFVVLLTDDIRPIEEAINNCADWEASKDRDFEAEQEANPIQFDYAAVHYIVYCKNDLDLSPVRVRARTPCEVQVKTILQHAYSELTHDTIYKPKVVATAAMRRAAAKSSALIEATNDYFRQIVDQVTSTTGPSKVVTETLSEVYRTRVGRAPELTRAEGLLVDAYESEAGLDLRDRLTAFLDSNSFVADRVRSKAESRLLFRQPSILFVYFLASEKPTNTKAQWPLTPDELRPIYVDLGMAFDNY